MAAYFIWYSTENTGCDYLVSIVTGMFINVCVKFVCARVCVYICVVCVHCMCMWHVCIVFSVLIHCSNDACFTSSERLRQRSPEKDDSDSGTD